MNCSFDPFRCRRLLGPVIVAWFVLVFPVAAQPPPPDATWTADAALDVERPNTDAGLGAIQGVVMRDGKVYAYGDVFRAEPGAWASSVRSDGAAVVQRAGSSGFAAGESRSSCTPLA